MDLMIDTSQVAARANQQAAAQAAPSSAPAVQAEENGQQTITAATPANEPGVGGNLDIVA